MCGAFLGVFCLHLGGIALLTDVLRRRKSARREDDLAAGRFAVAFGK